VAECRRDLTLRSTEEIRIPPLENMSMDQLISLKERVMRINVVIHAKAVRTALDYLQSKPQYSDLEWQPLKASGAHGVDLMGTKGSEVRVVAEVKTDMLTGTDARKKERIENDLLRLHTQYPAADRYFFTIYDKTADFAHELLCKRDLEKKIITLNLMSNQHGASARETITVL